MKIIVDSNIVFSALLSKDNNSKTLLISNKIEIYTCNFLFVEIFKHRKRIESISKLKEDDLLMQLEKVTRRINFVNEESVPKEIYQKAYNLCKNVDEKDTPFVALTIFLNGHLLTGDKKIFEALKKNKFNVISINDLLKKI